MAFSFDNLKHIAFRFNSVKRFRLLFTLRSLSVGSRLPFGGKK
jgi:hypothetical protein